MHFYIIIIYFIAHVWGLMRGQGFREGVDGLKRLRNHCYRGSFTGLLELISETYAGSLIQIKE